MKRTVTEHDFRESFQRAGRGASFTHEGLSHLHEGVITLVAGGCMGEGHPRIPFWPSWEKHHNGRKHTSINPYSSCYLVEQSIRILRLWG